MLACRYSFGTAAQVLPVPELAPFRLTRQLAGALKPHDAAQLLLQPAAAGMAALRGSAGVLEVRQLGPALCVACAVVACTLVLFLRPAAAFFSHVDCCCRYPMFDSTGLPRHVGMVRSEAESAPHTACCPGRR